jgi:hypothetical protein
MCTFQMRRSHDEGVGARLRTRAVHGASTVRMPKGHIGELGSSCRLGMVPATTHEAY